MKPLNNKILQLLLAFVFAISGSVGPLYAEDFRSEEKRAQFNGYIEETRVIRMAIAIGRAAGAIPKDRAEDVYEALKHNKSLPADLNNDIQKLIRIAQIAVFLQDNKYFFTHGYEFETVHPNHDAKWDFQEGAEKFLKLLSQTVGVQGYRIYEQVANYRDGKNRGWKLKTETVRKNDYNDGYELISPPITTADDIEQIAALMWRLGDKNFGQSNDMTGGHQTFSLVPVGQKADSKTVARVFANMMLMQAQFSPAIFELLDVQRFGGPENFFLRPTVFDFRDMLLEIQKLSENGTLDAEKLNKLMYEKYIKREFFIQANVSLKNELIDEKEMTEMQSWTIEQMAAYRPAWKYRDLRMKVNVQNPEKSLLEVRIGDYVDDRPEQAILETYLYEKMLNKAWEMAVAGETFQLNVPVRKTNETDKQYWSRLANSSAGSLDRLLKSIDITNSEMLKLINKETFKVVNLPMRANEQTSFGFEIEGYSEILVNLILPRDPKLRAEWSEMSEKKRVEVMNDMGFDFDDDFSWDRYRILTTEFYADTDKYPFLSPDLHLEASGNWEIKTSARGIQTIEELQAAARKINYALPEELYGMHVHVFLPENNTNQLAGRNAKYFTDYMERLSFYMLARGYADAPVNEPAHYFDSWSLDRYSIKDLQAVMDHLTGKKRIESNLAQKYHNVAFRPVRGGLDIEYRDLDDDYEYGIGLAKEMEQITRTGEFGGIAFDQDEPLFFGFGENAKSKEKDFQLVTAMSNAYSLTSAQKDLLRKFQFEIYKPSMKDYIFFADFSAYAETPDDKLDTEFIHSNFENNLVLPLLNYDNQSFLTNAQKSLIRERRAVYLERMKKLLNEIEQNPKYAFLKEHNNFLHLCDWLKRSTHSTRPDFSLVSKKDAEKQRELLEDLVYKLRSLSVRFVRETRIDQMFEKSIDPALMKSLSSRVGKKSAAKKCDQIFKKK